MSRVPPIVATVPIKSWIAPDYFPSLVSVVIPTYNRAALLDQAIQSIFDQSYRPIECLIVDDGSTDSTHAVVEKWEMLQADGFEVRYLSQPNAGAAAARNLGTRASRGEFIQYLDSDDLLCRDKVAVQVDILNRFRSIDGVFGDWDVGSVNDRSRVKAFRDKDLIAQFLGKQCISLFSFLMTRSIVGRIGPWDESLSREEEIDFHLRGVLAGGRFIYKSLSCGLWRTHDGERVSVHTTKKGVLEFRKKWIAILQERGALTEARRQALSDGLFHSATSREDSDQQLTAEMLRLARDLYPGRREFQSGKMRITTALLGKSLAIRIWLWRARKTRRATQYR